MKKRLALQFFSLFLACLLSLGSATAAQSEGAGAWDDQAYAALVQRLYGDGPPEAEMPTLIGGLQHIAGLGGDYIITKGLDTIWGWIFGTDDSSQQILASLDRIERELTDITKHLNLLIYMLKEQNLENRLREKVREMNDASTVLSRAIDEFDNHSYTAEERDAALDIWFNYKPAGYANAFYFFANYCQRVSGKTVYKGQDALSLYDDIADLKWAFDEGGAAYREMQREMDIHFIMRMSAVLNLWLAKETRPGYTSKHSQKDLDMYRRMLIDGLTDVIEALNARPIVTTPGILTLHGTNGGQRQSFEIVIGDPIPGQQAQPLDLRDTMRTYLKEGTAVAASEEAMRAFILASRPEPLEYGGEYRLIERGELELLVKEAAKRNLTPKELLVNGGFPGGDWKHVLYSSAERKNTPLKFSDQVQKMRRTNVHPPVEYSLRQLDIFTADLTAKSIWNPSVMGFGRVDDNDLKTLIVSYERQAESYAAIFPIYEGRVQFAQNTGSFLPVWVRSSTVSSIPDPEDEKPSPYHMEEPTEPDSETLEGIITQLRSGDMPGSPQGLTLAIPDGTMDFVIPANVMVDTLREGMIVRVTYRSQDGINIIEKIEITGNPSPDDTLQVTEGIVLSYDVAMEIIGQPPIVTLAIPGGEQAFSAPYGLPDDLDVGAMAHVHYYVLDGVNIADDISILIPPAPSPDDPPVPVPNPNPTADPVDPVPAPVMAWVEGYVMMRLDDPAVLAPGQLRELTISAAGQNYALQIPEQITLPDDAQTGAFVHVDYTAYQNGRNLVSSIYVMQPAPQPTDAPMPGPIDDPMPGPIEAPIPGSIDG